jgi:hypothetical protein
MTITNQDVDVYRGDSAELEITLTDVNGNPFVLPAGGTIKYRVAPTAHSSEDETLIRKELGVGIDLNTGVATVSLLSEDTELIPDSYYQELKIYDGTDIATAMTGNFQVRQALSMPKIRQASAKIAMIGNTRV